MKNPTPMWLGEDGAWTRLSFQERVEGRGESNEKEGARAAVELMYSDRKYKVKGTFRWPQYPQKHRIFPIKLVYAGLFTGHDPTRGSTQEVFKISWVGSGRVGSGRVGSGRVGSSRVKSFSKSNGGWTRSP